VRLRRLTTIAVSLGALAATLAFAATASAALRVAARVHVADSTGAMRFDGVHNAVWVITTDNATGTSRLTKLDPVTLQVESSTPLAVQDAEFYGLEIGLGRVWVSNFPDDTANPGAPGTISSYDGNGQLIGTRPSYGHGPEGMAFLDGKVWVANHHQDGPGLGGSVVEIDPDTGAQLAHVSVGAAQLCCGPQQLAAADGAVWAGVPNLDALVRVDAATLATTPFDAGGGSKGGACGSVVADQPHHRLWMTDGGCAPSDIMRVDTQTGTITQRLNVGAGANLDYGMGSLWIGAYPLGFKGQGTFVEQVDPTTGSPQGKVAIGGSLVDVAAGTSAVYADTQYTGEVIAIVP
jgi:hypothetical protein